MNKHIPTCAGPMTGYNLAPPSVGTILRSSSFPIPCYLFEDGGCCMGTLEQNSLCLVVSTDSLPYNTEEGGKIYFDHYVKVISSLGLGWVYYESMERL